MSKISQFRKKYGRYFPADGWAMLAFIIVFILMYFLVLK